MKRLGHIFNRSLPAQGWPAIVCAPSAVMGGGVGSFAASSPIAQRETLNAMVPGEGSA